MKILMLHGSRQSGELFRAKIQGLEKLTKKALGLPQSCPVEFIYPTAPFSLAPTDNNSDLRSQHGAWSWFDTQSIDGIYPGLDKCLKTIASILESSGPFDGIVGFSQGAALASMVVSLLEDSQEKAFNRLEINGGIPFPVPFRALNHPQFKFLVSISGYAASHSDYRAFYEPPIQTPALHFLGSLDNIVDEEASMKLVGSFCDPGDESKVTILRHPGGHSVPGGKRELGAIALFIKSTIS